MLQYNLECIAFQLVFLIIYDFFLKRETFFQWNRAYLIGTYVLSMVLPWVKIEALKTTVPEKYYVYPEFLWDANTVSATVTPSEATGFHLSWEEGVLYGGMFIATIYFGYKLYQIYKLRKTGTIRRFPGFTQIIVKNSELAFSFFRSIFLGDKVVQREHQSIIRHELVHIEQRHSWDLLFFELMRIVGWFNPLVYVYQNRISELHEFIADSKAAKSDKKQQYEFLLSQVFQTENISFVNQFFKTSLIKRRIAMLQRTQSQKIWQLKYLLLLPLVFGMLVYTSLEAQEKEEALEEQTSDDAALIERLNAKIDEEVAEVGSIGQVHKNFFLKYEVNPFAIIMSKEAYFERELLTERNFSYYLDSLKQVETPFYRRNTFPKRPLPSTARYKNYVHYIQAFQILDKNLISSIGYYFSNSGIRIRLMNTNEAYPESHYEYQVENVKDLTRTEVMVFNRLINETFQKKASGYEGIVLTDGQYAFEVFKAQLLEGSGQTIIEREPKTIQVGDVQNLTPDEETQIFKRLTILSNQSEDWELLVTDASKKSYLNYSPSRGSSITGPNGEIIPALQVLSFEPSQKDAKDIQDFVTSVNRKKYEQLITERQRLLENSNESNPVIVNLDQQIEALGKAIFGNGEIVPFAKVEQVPIFPGCEDASDKRACFQEKMQRHISKNFIYPKEAHEKGIQGRVAIMFNISASGAIENIKTRGPDTLLENEAERIIARLPDMQPGKHKGEVVNVPFSIPITFKLQGASIEKNSSDSGLFEVLPTNSKGVDTDLKKTVDTYNLLVLERKRLLKKSNKENPMIEDLDQQIMGLANKIKASGKYDSLLIFSRSAVPQTPRTYDQAIDVPFAVVDEVPVFPGCEDAADKRSCFQEKIQKHISKNFRYPQDAQEEGVQGRVSVLFTMGKDGNIGNIRLRGPNELLEAEAERIITLLPKMKPGKHKGKAVRVPFSIPITFKLQREQNEFPLRLDAWQTPQLILIDGEESTKETMNLLNPDDIESINVLKGEYAFNLYGEKGKNGVLLVQTKKNSAGIEESNEIYKANTNIMAVSANAKDKNGAKLISGTVTDGYMGLPGATIGIEGTERGTISDFDGKFELRAKKGDVLILQYIGLPVLRFTVTDETNYQITKKK